MDSQSQQKWANTLGGQVRGVLISASHHAQGRDWGHLTEPIVSGVSLLAENRILLTLQWCKTAAVILHKQWDQAPNSAYFAT